MSIKIYKGGSWVTVSQNANAPIGKADTLSIGRTDTTLTESDKAYYLSFVDVNNPHNGRDYEHFYTGAGVTFSPITNDLGVSGSLVLSGTESSGDGDIHSKGGSDGIFAIHNYGAGHLSLNIRDHDDDNLGIATFSGGQGENSQCNISYFRSNVSPAETDKHNLGDSTSLRWNNVYANQYYGDGSNLTCVGGATAWQPDQYQNLKAGCNAGAAIEAGNCYNIFIGHEAGRFTSACQDTESCTYGGDDNVFVGFMAGHHNTTGSYNIFTGSSSGYCNQTGNANIALGNKAGRCLCNGTCNIFLGSYAASNTVLTGNHNIFMGYRTGHCITVHSNNIFLGYCTGANVAGMTNIAIGGQALFGGGIDPSSCVDTTLTGQGNVAIGEGAGKLLQNGSYSHNIFLGHSAGQNQTAGCCNVVIGYNAGTYCSTEGCQLSIGINADKWITGDSSFNIRPGKGIIDCSGSCGAADQVLTSHKVDGVDDNPDNYYVKWATVVSQSSRAETVKITEDAIATDDTDTHYIWFGDNSTKDEYDGLQVDKNALVYKQGNLGIGTNEPITNPHGNTTVSGKFNVFNSGGPLHINYKTDTNNGIYFNYDAKRTGNDVVVVNHNYRDDGETIANHTIESFNDNSSFQKFGTHDGTLMGERLRITGEGHVGIGTTNPIANDPNTEKTIKDYLADNEKVLAVGIVTAHEYYGTFRGTIDGSATIVTDKIQASDGTYAQVVDGGTDGHFKVLTEGTERLRITATGVTQLNIGSNSAYTEPLLIRNSGTGSGANVGLAFWNGDMSSTGAGAMARIKAIDQGNHDGALAFETALHDGWANTTTERLRIDSSGHLLHGVTADEDTTGNEGLRFINTGDIQIDGDQQALVFRSTNNTAQTQSAIEWWNENGAGIQAKILVDRTAVSQAPSDLVFYTSANVDTAANSGTGDITERLRIGSSGQIGLGKDVEGTWTSDFGESNQVLTSKGDSSAAVWQSLENISFQPAGDDKQLQWNNNNSLAGTANLEWGNDSGTITIKKDGSFVRSGNTLVGEETESSNFAEIHADGGIEIKRSTGEGGGPYLDFRYVHSDFDARIAMDRGAGADEAAHQADDNFSAIRFATGGGGVYDATKNPSGRTTEKLRIGRYGEIGIQAGPNLYDPTQDPPIVNNERNDTEKYGDAGYVLKSAGKGASVYWGINTADGQADSVKSESVTDDKDYILTFIDWATTDGTSNIFRPLKFDSDRNLKYNPNSNLLTAPNLTVTGITTLGDALNIDITTFSSKVKSHILPDPPRNEDGTVDDGEDANKWNLGEDANRWGTVYADSFVGAMSGTIEKINTTKSENQATTYLTFTTTEPDADGSESYLLTNPHLKFRSDSSDDGEKLTVDCDVVLGNSTTDTISIKGSLTSTLDDNDRGSIVPSIDSDGVATVEFWESGSGYTSGPNQTFATSGGTGTGLTINLEIFNSGSSVDNITFPNKGSGYEEGDMVTLVGGDNNAIFKITGIKGLDFGSSTKYWKKIYAREYAGKFTGTLTSRKIEMTGDVAWDVNFDGSDDVTAAGTIQEAAVEESMLNINNDPSDGDFLKYVDGTTGMKWVANPGSGADANTLKINATNDETQTGDFYPTFVDGSGASKSVYMDSELKYNAKNDILTVKKFTPSGTFPTLAGKVPVSTVNEVDGVNVYGWAWASVPSGGSSDTANNLAGGQAGDLPYQSAANTTTFLSISTTEGDVLKVNTSTGLPEWGAAPAGSIIQKGDTSAEVVDTGSNGHFKVVTEDTERLRIESNGQWNLGNLGSDTEKYGDAGYVLKSQGKDAPPVWGSIGDFTAGTTKIATIKDQRSTDSFSQIRNGGAAVAGANYRVFNTLNDPHNIGISLLGPPEVPGSDTSSYPTVIKVPAGTYSIKWSAPAYNVKEHNTVLLYGTQQPDSASSQGGTVYEVQGSAEYTARSNTSGLDYSQTSSTGMIASVTFTQTNYIRLKHWCHEPQDIYGLGSATWNGTTPANIFGDSVFTQIQIEDLSTAVKEGTTTNTNINLIPSTEDQNVKYHPIFVDSNDGGNELLYVDNNASPALTWTPAQSLTTVVNLSVEGTTYLGSSNGFQADGTTHDKVEWRALSTTIKPFGDTSVGDNVVSGINLGAADRKWDTVYADKINAGTILGALEVGTEDTQVLYTKTSGDNKIAAGTYNFTYANNSSILSVSNKIGPNGTFTGNISAGSYTIQNVSGTLPSQNDIITIIANNQSVTSLRRITVHSVNTTDPSNHKVQLNSPFYGSGSADGVIFSANSEAKVGAINATNGNETNFAQISGEGSLEICRSSAATGHGGGPYIDFRDSKTGSVIDYDEDFDARIQLATDQANGGFVNHGTSKYIGGIMFQTGGFEPPAGQERTSTEAMFLTGDGCLGITNKPRSQQNLKKNIASSTEFRTSNFAPGYSRDTSSFIDGKVALDVDGIVMVRRSDTGTESLVVEGAQITLNNSQDQIAFSLDVYGSSVNNSTLRIIDEKKEVDDDKHPGQKRGTQRFAMNENGAITFKDYSGSQNGDHNASNVNADYGTVDQVLTSKGHGTSPVWQSISDNTTGGGLTLLRTVGSESRTIATYTPQTNTKLIRVRLIGAGGGSGGIWNGVGHESIHSATYSGGGGSFIEMWFDAADIISGAFQVGHGGTKGSGGKWTTNPDGSHAGGGEGGGDGGKTIFYTNFNAYNAWISLPPADRDPNANYGVILHANGGGGSSSYYEVVGNGPGGVPEVTNTTGKSKYDKDGSIFYPGHNGNQRPEVFWDSHGTINMAVGYSASHAGDGSRYWGQGGAGKVNRNGESWPPANGGTPGVVTEGTEGNGGKIWIAEFG